MPPLLCCRLEPCPIVMPISARDPGASPPEAADPNFVGNGERPRRTLPVLPLKNRARAG